MTKKGSGRFSGVPVPIRRWAVEDEFGRVLGLTATEEEANQLVEQLDKPYLRVRVARLVVPK